MAILTWNDPSEIHETDKAVGIDLKYKGDIKLFWIPKSLIINKRNWKKANIIEVPDWFYDEKVGELFPDE